MIEKTPKDELREIFDEEHNQLTKRQNSIRRVFHAEKKTKQKRDIWGFWRRLWR